MLIAKKICCSYKRCSYSCSHVEKTIFQHLCPDAEKCPEPKMFFARSARESKFSSRAAAREWNKASPALGSA